MEQVCSNQKSVCLVSNSTVYVHVAALPSGYNNQHAQRWKLLKSPLAVLRCRYSSAQLFPFALPVLTDGNIGSQRQYPRTPLSKAPLPKLQSLGAYLCYSPSPLAYGHNTHCLVSLSSRRPSISNRELVQLCRRWLFPYHPCETIFFVVRSFALISAHRRSE